jgi:hypothetical protein
MRKNLITLGLVSAFGTSTAMAVDLTNAKDTPDVFALDSVVATDIDAVTEAINLNGVTVIDRASVGVGVADGNQIFIRVDLANGVFNGDVATSAFGIDETNTTTTTSTTTTTTSTTGGGTTTTTITNTNTSTTTTTVISGAAIAKGGLDGDSFVIFDITGPAGGIEQTDFLRLSSNVGHVAAGPASVSVSSYETLANAINQENGLSSSSGTYATTADGVADDSTAINATAEVSTLFTRFDDLSLTAAIGSVTFDSTVATTGARVAATGFAHTVADSLDSATSDITIEGDFSFGDWEINDQADCAGTTLIALTAATDAGSADGSDISGIEGADGYLCVTVDGTEVINQGSYSYALEYDTVANAVFPAADGAGTVGSIAHNGTTVQVPYMTTFASYNQRFVMVNRGATDADYTFTFTTEDGTTATAGTAATGTIPAGETLVVRATDIVTLTGNTRTAGTVVIVAPDANISVAAQQVNVADSGTDTVILN